MARDVLVFYSQQETLDRWTAALGPELPDLDMRAVAADGHYAGDPAEGDVAAHRATLPAGSDIGAAVPAPGREPGAWTIGTR